MATTFNLELNPKPSKNKTYAVLLRITQVRKHKRLKTSVEVNKKSDFNPKAKQGFWIRTSEPQHKKWNETLEKELEEAKQTYRDLRQKGLASKELIKSTIVDSEVAPSFFVFAKKRCQNILREGGHRNYKKYNGFCNKLENYLHTINKSDLLTSEITPSFLSGFEAFLHSLKNERNPEAKLHHNTIEVYLNVFKALVNRAIKVEKHISQDQNPFNSFDYEKTIKTVKDKLNQEEINRIEDLDLPKGSLIWHCRNYFLFSFYLAGIRAGDLIQLRWSNITSDGRLEYRMSKTQNDRSIKLHQKAKSILQQYYKNESKPTDYIFPLLKNDAPYAKAFSEEQKATLPSDLLVKLNNTIGSKNALINKNLKKIVDQAGINKRISFHTSRHSFAKIAKEKKVDNNHLKSLLGHSSLKITEAYMGNFETEETDKVMDSIFGDNVDPLENLKKQLEEMDPAVLEKLLSEIKGGKQTNNS